MIGSQEEPASPATTKDGGEATAGESQVGEASGGQACHSEPTVDEVMLLSHLTHDAKPLFRRAMGTQDTRLMTVSDQPVLTTRDEILATKFMGEHWKNSYTNWWSLTKKQDKGA